MTHSLSPQAINSFHPRRTRSLTMLYDSPIVWTFDKNPDLTMNHWKVKENQLIMYTFSDFYRTQQQLWSVVPKDSFPSEESLWPEPPACLRARSIAACGTQRPDRRFRENPWKFETFEYPTNPGYPRSLNNPQPGFLCWQNVDRWRTFAVANTTHRSNVESYLTSIEWIPRIKPSTKLVLISRQIAKRYSKDARLS